MHHLCGVFENQRSFTLFGQKMLQRGQCVMKKPFERCSAFLFRLQCLQIFFGRRTSRTCSWRCNPNCYLTGGKNGNKSSSAPHLDDEEVAGVPSLHPADHSRMFMELDFFPPDHRYMFRTESGGISDIRSDCFLRFTILFSWFAAFCFHLVGWDVHPVLVSALEQSDLVQSWD